MPVPRTSIFALTVLATSLAAAVPAHALECPAPTDAPALAHVDVETRIQFLTTALRDETHRQQAWSWGWGTTYATAAVTQASILPFIRDPGVRVDLSVGAISAAFGSLTLFLLPLRLLIPAGRVLDAQHTPDRCRVLADAEQAVFGGARVESLATSWFSHVGNVVFNVGLMLVLGLGFGRWQSAWISAGVGTAIGELNLFTQPANLGRAWDEYRRGGYSPPPPVVRWQVVPTFGPVTGITLAVSM